VAEEGRTVHDPEGSEAGATGADPEVTAATRMSRMQSRLRKRLQQRRLQPEPINAFALLTTEEIQQALALTERGGVLPNGGVRYPEAFQEATPVEREALQHWARVCNEPLDHLELAEELVDRMGEAHGWRSREALDAALLLERLELPDESSWFVGKMAEAILNLYAELDEHPHEPEHAKVRGAVRRIGRLEDLDRLDPESLEDSAAGSVPSEGWEDPEQEAGPSQEPPGTSESIADEPEEVAAAGSSTADPQEGTDWPWYRRWFG
jgi:hypothetical protein